MSDGYSGPERRRTPHNDRRDQSNSWLQLWLTPAAAMVVFGGIVWGVQLNFQVGELIKEVGGLESETRSMGDQLRTVSENQLRTGLILEGLEKRLNRVEANGRPDP